MKDEVDGHRALRGYDVMCDNAKAEMISGVNRNILFQYAGTLDLPEEAYLWTGLQLRYGRHTKIHAMLSAIDRPCTGSDIKKDAIRVRNVMELLRNMSDDELRVTIGNMASMYGTRTSVFHNFYLRLLQVISDEIDPFDYIQLFMTDESKERFETARVACADTKALITIMASSEYKDGVLVHLDSLGTDIPEMQVGVNTCFEIPVDEPNYVLVPKSTHLILYGNGREMSRNIEDESLFTTVVDSRIHIQVSNSLNITTDFIDQDKWSLSIKCVDEQTKPSYGYFDVPENIGALEAYPRFYLEGYETVGMSHKHLKHDAKFFYLEKNRKRDWSKVYDDSLKAITPVFRNLHETVSIYHRTLGTPDTNQITEQMLYTTNILDFLTAESRKKFTEYGSNVYQLFHNMNRWWFKDAVIFGWGDAICDESKKLVVEVDGEVVHYMDPTRPCVVYVPKDTNVVLRTPYDSIDITYKDTKCKYLELQLDRSIVVFKDGDSAIELEDYDETEEEK